MAFGSFRRWFTAGKAPPGLAPIPPDPPRPAPDAPASAWWSYLATALHASDPQAVADRRGAAEGFIASGEYARAASPLWYWLVSIAANEDAVDSQARLLGDTVALAEMVEKKCSTEGNDSVPPDVEGARLTIRALWHVAHCRALQFASGVADTSVLTKAHDVFEQARDRWIVGLEAMCRLDPHNREYHEVEVVEAEAARLRLCLELGRTDFMPCARALDCSRADLRELRSYARVARKRALPNRAAAAAIRRVLGDRGHPREIWSQTRRSLGYKLKPLEWACTVTILEHGAADRAETLQLLRRMDSL